MCSYGQHCVSCGCSESSCKQCCPCRRLVVQQTAQKAQILTQRSGRCNDVALRLSPQERLFELWKPQRHCIHGARNQASSNTRHKHCTNSPRTAHTKPPKRDRIGHSQATKTRVRVQANRCVRCGMSPLFCVIMIDRSKHRIDHSIFLTGPDFLKKGEGVLRCLFECAHVFKIGVFHYCSGCCGFLFFFFLFFFFSRFVCVLRFFDLLALFRPLRSTLPSHLSRINDLFSSLFFFQKMRILSLVLLLVFVFEPSFALRSLFKKVMKRKKRFSFIIFFFFKKKKLKKKQKTNTTTG